MKINLIIGYAVYIISLMGISTSCTDKDVPETIIGQARTVDVTFTAPIPSRTQNTTDNEKETALKDISVLTFQKEANKLTLLSSEGDEWTFTQKGQYTLTKNLEIGEYYFAFAKGLARVQDETKGNEGNNCFLIEQTNSLKLNEHIIHHPVNNENILKDLSEELFLDNDKDSVNKLVDLGIYNRLKFQRTLTHAQGRLDILVIKGVETTPGNYQPITPSSNPEEYDNPLNRIEKIQISLPGVNSQCNLSTQAYFEEKTFQKDLIPNSDFSEFDLIEYKKDFENPQDQYFSQLADCNQNNSRIKSILLFPSEITSGKLTITYTNGDTREIAQNLTLERNRATLLTIWIINEHIKLELGFDGDLPAFGDSAQGDEGFWN